MRRIIVVILGALLALALMAPGASAHVAGPCDDTDGGGPSGREYAAHHIVSLAKLGALGAEPSGKAHTPGSHMGFSACLGVH